MTVVVSQIMKYYGNFFSQMKIYVTIPMSCGSKSSSYVTMICKFFIVMINKFFRNPARITQLKLFFFSFTHDQIFVKLFFYYFLAIFILLKNCSNKFISWIFTSKKTISVLNLSSKQTSLQAKLQVMWS